MINFILAILFNQKQIGALIIAFFCTILVVKADIPTLPSIPASCDYTTSPANIVLNKSNEPNGVTSSYLLVDMVCGTIAAVNNTDPTFNNVGEGLYYAVAAHTTSTLKNATAGELIENVTDDNGCVVWSDAVGVQVCSGNVDSNTAPYDISFNGGTAPSGPTTSYILVDLATANVVDIQNTANFSAVMEGSYAALAVHLPNDAPVLNIGDNLHNYLNSNRFSQCGDDIVSNKLIYTIQSSCSDPVFLYADDCDFDGDGVNNDMDLDDDNDGVLDTEENVCTTSYDVITPTSATAQSEYCDFFFGNCSGPDHTIDGSGLTGSGINALHDAPWGDIQDGWLGHDGNTSGQQTSWVQYEFSTPTSMDAVAIWASDNPNWGVGDAPLWQFTIDVTHDGGTWTSGVFETANPGLPTSNQAQIFPFASIFNNITTIRINIIDGWNQTATGVYSQGWSGHGSYNVTLAEFRGLISCVADTDNDGIANRFDLDSDGDGCSDAYEAGATTNTTTDFQFSDVAAGDANGISPSVDPSDNGILNYTPTYADATDANVSNCPQPCTDPNLYADNCDFDGDSVLNIDDIDDDNDGILDTAEEYTEGAEVFGGGWFQDTNGNPDGYLPGPLNNTLSTLNAGPGITETQAIASNGSTVYQMTGASTSSLAAAQAANDYLEAQITPGADFIISRFGASRVPNQGTYTAALVCVDANNNEIILVDGVTIGSGNGGFVDGSAIENPVFVSGETKAIRVYFYNVSGNHFMDNPQFFVNPVTGYDTDSDGIPNQFDLDSDGDGCYDSYEASVTGATTDGSVTDSLAATTAAEVGANGLANAIESNDTGTATTTYASTYANALDNAVNNCSVSCTDPTLMADECDFDGDGIDNIDDLDDDNDGILDTDEMTCTTSGCNTFSGASGGTATLYKRTYWSQQATGSNGISQSQSITTICPNTDAYGLPIRNEPSQAGAVNTTPPGTGFRTVDDSNNEGNNEEIIMVEATLNIPPSCVLGGSSITFWIDADGTDARVVLYVSPDENPTNATYQGKHVGSSTGGDQSTNHSGSQVYTIPNSVQKMYIRSYMIDGDDLSGITAFLGRASVKYSLNGGTTKIDIPDNWYAANSSDANATGGIVTTCTDLNSDGDGIPNRFDLDSDGDGCPDAAEANVTPTANLASGDVINGNGTTNTTTATSGANFVFNSPTNDSNGDGVYDGAAAVAGDYTTNALDANINTCNAPPVITNHSSNPTATENYAENGTGDVIDWNATDADGDTENGGGLTYALTGVDAALFTLNTATGILTWNAPPDFENPADANTDNAYEIIVTVTDANGTTDTQALTVNVTNVNEAPDVTAMAAVNYSENATTPVENAETTDDTDSEGSGLTYTLTGTDATLFSIDANGNVTFNTSPDFENPMDAGGNNVYDIIINVEDSGSLTDSTPMAITVTDVNEAPVVTVTPTINYPENATIPVDDAASTDDSDSEGSGLTYSLTGADAALFSIDANGVVSFIASPDFENPLDAGGNNVYDIIVNVTDSGSLTDSEPMAITVTNVNEAPDVTAMAAVNYSENATTPVENAETTDDTDSEGSGLTYTLTGTDAALFSIDANGNVTFNTSPDFENPMDAGGNNVYDIIINVEDSGNLTDSTPMAITVTDVNEAPVVTVTPTINYPENATIPVDDAASTDDSDSEGSGLTYSLTGADAALFSIDANGVVSFIASPDFENPLDAGGNNVYDIIVNVTDSGSLTDSEPMAITVTNVNEAPDVTAPTAINYLEDGTIAVLDAATTDDTDSEGSGLTYTLTGTDAALFNIDANGVVTFIASPDFENPMDNGGDNVYDIIINVEDSGTLTDTQPVAITVTDGNDAPTITSTNTVTIAENSVTIDDAIVDGTSIDDNDSEGSGLTYAFTGNGTNSPDEGDFSIDPISGELTFNTVPDFENPLDADMNNVYQVEIQVCDSGSLCDTQIITITVTDVDEDGDGLTGVDDPDDMNPCVPNNAASPCCEADAPVITKD